MKMRRALVGVDGNCGFALLGEDIQSGEAEFVEIDAIDIEKTGGGNRYYDTDWVKAANKACNEALGKLRERLGATDRSNSETWITYALDPSHPRHCP